MTALSSLAQAQPPLNPAAPAVDALLARAKGTPLLTAREEVALAKAAEVGALAEERLACEDPGPDTPALHVLAAEGRAAFERLVLANVRLVAWCARRHARGSRGTGRLPFDDLVAAGMFGLIRAVHKWDHTRGGKFSTYAVISIRSTQQRADWRASGLPVKVLEQQAWIRRARATLTTELGRTPTAVEVAQAVGLSAARIDELESYQRPQAHLDASLSSETGTTLGEVIADGAAVNPQDAALDASGTALVQDLLETLPPRQRQVVAMHFGLDGHEAAEPAAIAAACAVPVRVVTSTLERALAHLRDQALTGATGTPPR